MTYHVQTEDKGLETPLILSLVYVGGAILASKRTSYQDLIAEGFKEKALTERLQRQHKLLCAAILAGRIEDLKRMSGGEREATAAQTDTSAQAQTPPQAETPAQVQTPAPVQTPAQTPAPVQIPAQPQNPAQARPPAAVQTPAPPPAQTPAPAPSAPEATPSHAARQPAAPKIPPARRVERAKPPVRAPEPAPSRTAEPTAERAAPPALPPTAPPLSTPLNTPVSTPPPALNTTAPSVQRQGPPVLLGDIEVIPVNDPSFEPANFADPSPGNGKSAAPRETPLEIVSANDDSFFGFQPPVAPPSNLQPEATEVFARAERQAPPPPAPKATDAPLPSPRAAEKPAPPAPAATDAEAQAATPVQPSRVDEKSEALYISLLDDEGDFRAGELVTIRIYVGRGPYGTLPVDEAAVTVKVLGTTFRPLILSTKTTGDGTAIVRALLPRFTSGRAAILIRARAGEQETELRRIIHQN